MCVSVQFGLSWCPDGVMCGPFAHVFDRSHLRYLRARARVCVCGLCVYAGEKRRGAEMEFALCFHIPIVILWPSTCAQLTETCTVSDGGNEVCLLLTDGVANKGIRLAEPVCGCIRFTPSWWLCLRHAQVHVSVFDAFENMCVSNVSIQMIEAKNAQWKHQKPPSVFTFGFGARHNEDMLTSIGCLTKFEWSFMHAHVPQVNKYFFSGIWFGNVLPCARRRRYPTLLCWLLGRSYFYGMCMGMACILSFSILSSHLRCMHACMHGCRAGLRLWMRSTFSDATLILTVYCFSSG